MVKIMCNPCGRGVTATDIVYRHTDTRDCVTSSKEKYKNRSKKQATRQSKYISKQVTRNIAPETRTQAL
jgi:hypothetical protein